jgi:Zn-dependent protease with chaperone function
LASTTALSHGRSLAQLLCILGAPRERRWLDGLFDTHPPAEERIARLRAMQP